MSGAAGGAEKILKTGDRKDGQGPRSDRRGRRGRTTCKWRPGSQEPRGHLRETQPQRREQRVQRLRHGASLAARRPADLARGDGLQGQWCQIREGFRSSKGLVLRGGTERLRANIMISPNEQVERGNGGS